MSVLVVALVCLLVGGCAAPAPTATPTAAAAPTATAPATASPATAVAMDVRFAGTIHCASFPYSCGATLSVLQPDTVVGAAWRPPSTDPQWGPAWGAGFQADHFLATPVGALPRLTPGRHQLVVSLLGSSDLPTHNPDGSLALSLLGRCSTEVDVPPATISVSVLVTFVPNGQDFDATCSFQLTR